MRRISWFTQCILVAIGLPLGVILIGGATLLDAISGQAKMRSRRGQVDNLPLGHLHSASRLRASR